MRVTYILRDIGVYLSRPPVLFCDNLSALYMTVNPVLHARTKHIEIDYHFVREKVAPGSLVTQFVSSKNQLANIFTKPLSKVFFQGLRYKLGVHILPSSNLTGSDKEDNNSHVQPHHLSGPPMLTKSKGANNLVRNP